MTRQIVDQLGINVAVRAVHRKARPLLCAGDLRPDTALHALPSISFGVLRHNLNCLPKDCRPFGSLIDEVGRTYRAAVLPALRRTYSSTYRIPLPLYGSGGRSSRILAAICPS